MLNFSFTLSYNPFILNAKSNDFQSSQPCTLTLINFAPLPIDSGIQSSDVHNDIMSISNIIPSSPSTLPVATVDLPSKSSQNQHCTPDDSYSPPNTHHMVTCVKAGIFKPKLFHVTSSTPFYEPTSYKQAMQSLELLQAMKTKYATFMDHTWSLTPLPSGVSGSSSTSFM